MFVNFFFIRAIDRPTDTALNRDDNTIQSYIAQIHFYVIW